MLVALAAKCLAGLATGLRKKFGQYAGHVSKSMYFSSLFLLVLNTLCLLFIKGNCTSTNAYLPLSGPSGEMSAEMPCRLKGPCLFIFSNVKLTIAVIFCTKTAQNYAAIK